MKTRAINKTVAQMPFTEVINFGKADSDNSKIINILQADLINDVSVEVRGSLDGVNTLPVTDVIQVLKSQTSSGIILNNFPAPYVHLKFTNGSTTNSGTIEAVQYE